LAGVLHVLYTVIEKALTNANWRQNVQDIPKEIPLTTMKYAVALTGYYKSQRNIFQEVIHNYSN
jgi:hypothetical protein